MQALPSEPLDLAELRTSSYVIYVDLPKTQNTWLIVHGYTGAYDVVNSNVAAFLKSRETQRVSKPLFGSWEQQLQPQVAGELEASTIKVLLDRGYLTALDHESEVGQFENYVGRLHEQRLISSRSYIVMPTYNCNLRCHYCFQDQLRSDPQFTPLLGTMTLQMWDRINKGLDYLEEHTHKLTPGVRRNRSFTFFGGEPLLASSRKIVEYIISSQKRPDVNASFSAVTNATELDAYSDLLSKEAISHIQVTLDGPEEAHDKRRIYADGSGSFRKILNNIQIALDAGIGVTIRVNVDRNNASMLSALAATIEAEGWRAYQNFKAYVAPIHDYSGLQNAGHRRDFFNYSELDEFLEALKKSDSATTVFSHVDSGIRRAARDIFEKAQTSEQRSAYCGAHTGMYIFDSFGDIFACWDRTGDERYRIGKVADDSSVRLNHIGESWRSRNVVSNDTCKQCRYALHCGGGCAALAEVSSDTIFSNFCDAYGKRFRNAVAQAYEAYYESSSVKLQKTEAVAT